MNETEKDHENNLLQLIAKGRDPCPFYGLELIDRYFLNLERTKEQCGKLDPFGPCKDCYLQKEGMTPCWKICEYNTEPLERTIEKFRKARVCLQEFGDEWISFELWLEYFRNNYEIE